MSHKNKHFFPRLIAVDTKENIDILYKRVISYTKYLYFISEIS